MLRGAGTMVDGLRGALRPVIEEGLDPRIARHEGAGEASAAALRARRLDPRGPPPGPGDVPMLAPMHVPAGMADAAVGARLPAERRVEIVGAAAAVPRADATGGVADAPAAS